MKRSLRFRRLFLLLPILLLGCYPQGPEFIEDIDVVLTNYNDKYNFKANSTYALPDQIVKITGNVTEGDPPKFIPDAVATQMLARMKQNMDNLGYTQVDIGDSPDVILAPAAMEVTTITYWYDYWGWYWGGYYPGWGYPWYGYPAYASSYSTGTLLMILIDPTKESGDGSPIGQWTGAANGILTNSYDVARVNKAIDQAFSQSPYLKK